MQHRRVAVGEGQGGDLKLREIILAIRHSMLQPLPTRQDVATPLVPETRRTHMIELVPVGDPPISQQVATPQISIIIAVLNAAHLIGQQLDALVAAGHGVSYEILIADNGSRDHLAEVIAAYRDRLPSLRIIDGSRRRGQSHARNVAAAYARGEMLLFLDADDVIGPGFLQTVATASTQHDILAPRLEALRFNQAGWSRLGQHRQYYDLMRYYNEPYLYHVAASGMVVRRAVFLRLGGFDEGMFRLSDSEFCFRAQLHGHQLYFMPEAVVYYRHRTTLRGLLRQSYEWGHAELLLVGRFRRPVGVVGALTRWVRYAARWLKLIAQAPTLRSPSGATSGSRRSRATSASWRQQSGAARRRSNA